MKKRISFLLFIFLIISKISIAQNCAVVELAKDFSRNPELKKIVQDPNHLKAWHILFEQKTKLRASIPEIKLVAENLEQVEEAGGYNK